MSYRNLFKLFTIVILGVALLAAGCASQPSSAPATTTQAAKTTPPITSSSPISNPPTTTAVSTPSQTAVSTPAGGRVTSFPAAPAMQINTSKNYTATVDTSLGSFKIQLFVQDAPKTVNNFVFLSNQGYYNGVIFHRIIKAFMIQTGDPQGTGMGGPGYKFNDELPVKRKYDVNIVAMANAGPNTNGSQFFICTGPTAANLNNAPNYTQFGQVIEGMDIVQKIASVPVVFNPSSGETSKPSTPPVINSITITEQ